jgi:hypothetical protein
VTAGNLYVTSGTTVSNAITIGTAASSGWSTKSIAAGWDFSPTTTATSTGALAATTSGNTLTVGSLTKGAGLNASGVATYFGSFTNWSTSASGANTTLSYAETNDKYIGFSITTTTNNLNLTDIIAYKNRHSSTGVTQLAWEYAIGNGSFTQIGTYAAGATTSATGNSMSSVDLTGISALQNISAGTTVNFRLYGYGAYWKWWNILFSGFR